MDERDPTPEAAARLAAIHRRSLAAAPPREGQPATLAYRRRLFSLDRGNLWPRLTRYRGREGPTGETLAGTTNGAERAIGWWVKARSRSMRGDKRTASGRNVSRLIATPWAARGRTSRSSSRSGRGGGGRLARRARLLRAYQGLNNHVARQ